MATIRSQSSHIFLEISFFPGFFPPILHRAGALRRGSLLLFCFVKALVVYVDLSNTVRFSFIQEKAALGESRPFLSRPASDCCRSSLPSSQRALPRKVPFLSSPQARGKHCSRHVWVEAGLHPVCSFCRVSAFSTRAKVSLQTLQAMFLFISSIICS